jgi:hypothetical protein
MTTTQSPPRFLQVPSGFLATVRGFLVGDREPLDAVQTLRGIGYELGEEVQAALLERMGRDYPDAPWEGLDPVDFWRAASGFFADRGWGSVEFRDLHPGVGLLALSDWVEGESGGGPRGCHLSVGLFSALLERLSGSGVAVLEVPGSASGATQLLFGRPDVLAGVYESIRGGRPLEEAVAVLG